MPSDQHENVKLRVRVQPNASRTEITGFQEDALRIRINSPAQDGKANKALCRFLSKELGVSKSDVLIEKGQTSRNKLICIHGITTEQLEKKLPSQDNSV
jgi:uncharacterized protein (TIGR00251 family)